MESASNFETEKLEEGNRTVREIASFARDLVIILIVVLFIRSFIVTPFRINGSSMEESYHDREYILVDKFSYLKTDETSDTTNEHFLTKIESTIRGLVPIHMGDPTRGDVVVITPHVDKQREYFIKRVIGMPGDIIRFEDGNVLIKKPTSEQFIPIKESYLSASNSGQTRLPEHVEANQFLIPEGYYWVMGDNRQNSADSRSCFRNCYGASVSAHFIKRGDIVGKVFLNFGYFNIFNEDGLIQSGKITWTHPPRLFDHPRTAKYTELGE